MQAAQSVSLEWSPVVNPAAAGYILYIGTAHNSYSQKIDVGTNTVVTITGLLGGQTNYFVVASYNSARVESLPSNEAMFVAPGLGSPALLPQITVISPGSAAPGSQVNIYGVNFGSTTSVRFGGVNAAFTIVSDTLLVATVPASGNGSLTITSPIGSVVRPFIVLPAPVPSNDNFVSAQTVSGSAVLISTSTAGATKQSGEPNHSGNTGGHSIWYRWTAPTSGIWSMDATGSDINALLAVYTGNNVTGLSLVASNRTSGGALTNGLKFNSTAGTVYQIAVDGQDGAVGNMVWRMMPDVSTVTVYSNAFETADGFVSWLPLVGQGGWLRLGLAGSGVASGFPEQGQQAKIGFDAQIFNTSSLLYRPLNYTVDTNARPVVQFSVLMRVSNLLGLYDNQFAWVVRNASGVELFRITFNNSGRAITYTLDNGAGPVPTGATFNNSSIYGLLITMDFGGNTWSATLDGVAVVTGEPITTRGSALTLGHIAAGQTLKDSIVPGLDGMLFDNYAVTAGAGLAPRILAGLQNRTVAAGSNVVLSVAASGQSPMSYQWYCDNSPVPNATNASLKLGCVYPSQDGNYSVIVSNPGGAVASSAAVTVITSPPAALLAMPTFSRTTGTSLNLRVAAGNNYRFQASTNLKDWSTLGIFYATGTNVVCLDPAATNFSSRFYRVVTP